MSSTKTVQHAESPTCEAHTESLKGLEFSNKDKYVQAKNLFLKVPSKGGALKDRLFLICASVDTDIDPKKVSVRLGIKANSPLRLASEELFDQTLCIPRGSVNPFVMANGTTQKANVYLLLDKKGFQQNKMVLFHPMRNDYTTSISREDLEKFLEKTCGKGKFQFVDFSTDEAISLTLEEVETKEKPEKKPEPRTRDFSPPKRKGEQMFAENHLFTVKKAEDTMFATAFLKYGWVKV